MPETGRSAAMKIRLISSGVAIGVVLLLLFGQYLSPTVRLAAAVVTFGIGYSHLAGAVVFTKPQGTSRFIALTYRLAWTLAALALYSPFSGYAASFYILLFLFFLHIIENDMALAQQIRAGLAAPSGPTFLSSAACSVLLCTIAAFAAGAPRSWDYSWLYESHRRGASTLAMSAMVAGATAYHGTCWLMIRPPGSNWRSRSSVWAFHVVGTIALALIALVPLGSVGPVATILLSPHVYLLFSAMHAAHTTWRRHARSATALGFVGSAGG